MKQMLKYNSGISIIIISCLIPIIFWVFLLPLNLRFNNLSTTLTSLGQLTGLVGTVLFAVNIILAVRLQFLEKYFYGLDKVYIDHHLIGAIALILLLVHPLVLAIKYIPLSLYLTALFLLPSLDNLPVLYGIISLLLMIILLVLTLYYRPRYDVWKLTHKFLGLAFLLAALHVYFIPSDVSRSVGLRIYMLTVILLGLVAATYKIFFAGSFLKLLYTVKEVKVINDMVTEIVMEPKGEVMKYLPGQFIFVSFRDENLGKESHPFSLASGANDDLIRIVVKYSGDYTSKIKNLKVGSLAKIDGPFGKFNFRNFPNKNQIWLAGGIGITPFLGMIRSLKAKDNYKVDFYYAVNTREDAVFLDEILAKAKQYNKIRVLPHFSEVKGRINAKIISETSSGLVNKEILICGPVLMMRNLRDQFIDLGVKNELIHSEEFELSE